MLLGTVICPTEIRPVRVLLADDQAPTREGLRTLLSLSPQVVMVGEAANGMQTLDLVADKHPDVVLMDVHMPVMDGLTACAEIKCRWPDIRVIALTMDASRREAAIDAGADKFLVKGGASEELWNSILASPRVVRQPKG